MLSAEQLLLYGSGALDLEVKDQDPMRWGQGMPNGPGEQVLDHGFNVVLQMSTKLYTYFHFLLI